MNKNKILNELEVVLNPHVGGGELKAAAEAVYNHFQGIFVNQLVEQFHIRFKQAMYKETTPELLELRLRLILEELTELAIAGGSQTIQLFHKMLVMRAETLAKVDESVYLDINEVEVLDSLVDLQYVLSGTIVALGYQDVFAGAFEAVHKNNMDKTYQNYEYAEERVKGLSLENEYLEFETIVDEDEVQKVTLKINGKVIKPANHPKVDLNKFVGIRQRLIENDLQG